MKDLTEDEIQKLVGKGFQKRMKIMQEAHRERLSNIFMNCDSDKSANAQEERLNYYKNITDDDLKKAQKLRDKNER